MTEFKEQGAEYTLTACFRIGRATLRASIQSNQYTWDLMMHRAFADWLRQAIQARVLVASESPQFQVQPIADSAEKEEVIEDLRVGFDVDSTMGGNCPVRGTLELAKGIFGFSLTARMVAARLTEGNNDAIYKIRVFVGTRLEHRSPRVWLTDVAWQWEATIGLKRGI